MKSFASGLLHDARGGWNTSGGGTGCGRSYPAALQAQVEASPHKYEGGQ